MGFVQVTTLSLKRNTERPCVLKDVLTDTATHAPQLASTAPTCDAYAGKAPCSLTSFIPGGINAYLKKGVSSFNVSMNS